MAGHWIQRRPHQRRLSSGKYVAVRESWVCLEKDQDKKKKRRIRYCPQCNAKIISVRMPNGGVAHFEGGAGLTRVKHPCLHPGLGLSKKRDENTGDLFEEKDANF